MTCFRKPALPRISMDLLTELLQSPAIRGPPLLAQHLGKNLTVACVGEAPLSKRGRGGGLARGCRAADPDHAPFVPAILGCPEIRHDQVILILAPESFEPAAPEEGPDQPRCDGVDLVVSHISADEVTSHAEIRQATDQIF
jgi:hypothetical protein